MRVSPATAMRHATLAGADFLAYAPHGHGGAEVDDAGQRSARSVLLRPRGLERLGDGLEQSDQLVELERLQGVVRSFCEGVGQ
jgi:hypothetical protein